MSKTSNTTQVHAHFPAVMAMDVGGAAASGFSVDAQGTGSFTGLSYTVPAHAKGTVKAVIKVMALTSADIDKLNSLVNTMLSASTQSKVTSYEKVHASANLSFWSFLTGGNNASYDKVNTSLTTMGLTTAQITTIIDKLFDLASKMSHVEIDFTIDNSDNDYSVSGDLQLYTISGNITSSKGTAQYRMLADKGTAGGGTASASGKVIALS